MVEVFGLILREAHNEALTLAGGESPEEVRLTHPARWRKNHLEKLRQAAQSAGINDPTFIPEPVAAAVHFASEKLEVGEHVAVYDLGGGTFDAAAIRIAGMRHEVVSSEGHERLGGPSRTSLPSWHGRRAGRSAPGHVGPRCPRTSSD